MLTFNVFNQKLGIFVEFEITVLYALHEELRRYDLINFMIVDFEITDTYSEYGYTTFECTGTLETDTVNFSITEASNGEYNVHINELCMTEKFYVYLSFPSCMTEIF